MKSGYLAFIFIFTLFRILSSAAQVELSPWVGQCPRLALALQLVSPRSVQCSAAPTVPYPHPWDAAWGGVSAGSTPACRNSPGLCFGFNVCCPQALGRRTKWCPEIQIPACSPCMNVFSRSPCALREHRGGLGEIPVPKAGTELHPTAGNCKLPLQSWEIPAPSFAAPTRQEVWFCGPRQLLGVLVGEGTVV